MSTKYVVETFADLISAVQEELGADPNDTNVTSRIKRDINQVYLQEVCPDQDWSWLSRSVERQVQAFFSTGSATVTAGSTSVTLTTAPATVKSQLFSIDGYNEVYRIAQHTPNSGTLTLESPYTGTSGSSLSFKIWNDTVPLPADCDNTKSVRHAFRTTPLEGMGKREFDRLVATGPRAVSRPSCFCTGSLVDPDPFDAISGIPSSTFRSSSGLVRTLVFASTLGATDSALLLSPGDRIQISNVGSPSYNGDVVVSEITTTSVVNDTIRYTVGEVKYEASTAETGAIIARSAQTNLQSRYRELFVYPAIYDSVTTLYIDFKTAPPPLVEDDDEPLMPIGDRNVLVYGALSRQWVKHRDSETFSTNAALYTNKLSKMAGRIEDSLDLPKLQISKNYMEGKRRSRYARGFAGPASSGFSTGGGASVLQGTPSTVAVFGTDGRLQGDSLISTTELEFLDGVTSNVQTQLDAKIGADLGDGQILVGNSSNVASAVTPSGDVVIDDSGVTAISPGVIVDADIDASAAIDRTKVAAGTAGEVVINDASTGVLSSEAQLAASRGGTGSDSSSSTGVAHVSSGTWSYSSVGLGGSDVSGTLGNSHGGTGGDSSASTGIAHVSSGAWSYSTVALGGADVSGTLSKGNGGTGVTSVTIAPAASAFAGWDSNKNLSANNLIDGYASTATAAGTTTLSVSDAGQQVFTGSSTQTVKLPVASTLVTGMQWLINNLSSGVVTVQSSGGNTLQAMASNTQLLATCISASGTGTASWNWTYQSVQNTLSGGGSVTSVTFTGDGTVLSSTPSSAVTTTGTVTASLVNVAKNTYLGGPLSGANAAPTYKTFTAPTLQKFTATGTTTGYLFTISTSTTCAVGDTYTNNSHTYTVVVGGALSAQSGQVLFMSGASAPTSSGTLTRSSGSGTSSVTFTANVALATYTAPTSPAPLYVRVRGVGGGGGGSGGGSASAGAGGSGTVTAFGANLLLGQGGGGGPVAGLPASGGNATIASPAYGSVFPGGAGTGGVQITTSGGVATPNGMPGGVSYFGGNGGGAPGDSNGSTSSDARANTGSGGASGSAANVSGSIAGTSGSAGGTFDAIIPSPNGEYYYCVGANGGSGTAGTNGHSGGAGASGFVEVTEYYQ